MLSRIMRTDALAPDSTLYGRGDTMEKIARKIIDL
jgi:hypothetical protein